MSWESRSHTDTRATAAPRGTGIPCGQGRAVSAMAALGGGHMSHQPVPQQRGYGFCILVPLVSDPECWTGHGLGKTWVARLHCRPE